METGPPKGGRREINHPFPPGCRAGVGGSRVRLGTNWGGGGAEEGNSICVQLFAKFQQADHQSANRSMGGGKPAREPGGSKKGVGHGNRAGVPSHCIPS